MIDYTTLIKRAKKAGVTLSKNKSSRTVPVRSMEGEFLRTETRPVYRIGLHIYEGTSDTTNAYFWEYSQEQFDALSSICS